MSRYIDADVLRHDVLYHANAQYCKGNHDKEEAFTYCLYLIDCMPTLEVVRCKDCKYCEHWYADKGRCFLWHEVGIDVFEDGFCNYAERRLNNGDQI